ncbi:hypothetical protein DYB28_014304, partial [Aphanomyces astaci]
VIQTASACPNSCKKTVLETIYDDMMVMTDAQDFERVQERESPPSGGMSVVYVYKCDALRVGPVSEHALNSLLTACVDGVNACLLCGGSSNTLRSTFFHGSDKAPAHAGLALTMLQHLLLHLADKHGSGGNPSPHTPRYFVRLSFVEFYEETITDLLASKQGPTGSSPPMLALREDEYAGVDFKNATKVGPIQSSMDVQTAVYIKQVPTSGGPVVLSTLDIVDLPPFDRLAKVPTAVRLTEGPLLNKSLYAFESVCKAGASAASFPPYDASLLTRSLQQALGGDALTHVGPSYPHTLVLTFA